MAIKTKTLKFNMNDNVRIKLKDFGRAILKKNHDKLFSSFKDKPKFSLPNEDIDGWSKWQLWELFHAFGQHINIGLDSPFETEIELINRDIDVMNNDNNFINQLNKYISTAFENENEFLERFASDMGDLDDLVYCYMSSDRTNIVVLAHSGDMITSTIDTLDFINWCDEVDARK